MTNAEFNKKWITIFRPILEDIRTIDDHLFPITLTHSIDVLVSYTHDVKVLHFHPTRLNIADDENENSMEAARLIFRAVNVLAAIIQKVLRGDELSIGPGTLEDTSAKYQDDVRGFMAKLSDLERAGKWKRQLDEETNEGLKAAFVGKRRLKKAIGLRSRYPLSDDRKGG